LPSPVNRISRVIVKQEYWDQSYASLPLAYDEDGVQFKELFKRFVPRGGSCFEVGCYPGNYLAYFGRRFGYTVSGIDTTPFIRDKMPAFLESLGVPVGELHCGEFMAFQTGKQYDMVFSNGFVEHFENYREVIRKHIALVKPGGTIVLSAPNFRNLQFVLHWMLDRQNLRRHVLSAMNLGAWHSVLSESGMEPLYHGYYRTWEFWADSVQNSTRKLLTRYIRAVARRVDARVNWPNPLLSPYMVSISRKAR
jgi:2-polyprenyl-3-methyl-5-hydroxy-6-metoxy-1,4-benzoquinol methylase